MRVKRCILTSILVLFVSLITVFMLILQKSSEDGHLVGSFPRHSAIEKSRGDFASIMNQMQRRKLSKSWLDRGKNPKVGKWYFEKNGHYEETGKFDDKSVKNRRHLGVPPKSDWNLDFNFVNRENQEDQSINADERFRQLMSDENARNLNSDMTRFSGGKSLNSNPALAGNSNPAQAGNSNYDPEISRDQRLNFREAGNGNQNKHYPHAGNPQPIGNDFSKINSPQQPLIRIDSNRIDTSPVTPAVPHRPQEPTIVTALFDIGRGNWNQYKRPYSMYQDYMKRLLALDINLVAFADNEGAKFIREHRSGKMHKTMIQEMSIQQLPLYAHYPRIKELIDREQASWKQEWDSSMQFHPESISPEYDILMNSKPYFIYYVANWNPFKSDYFYWLDAGYGHGQAVYPQENTYWAPENLMKPDIGQKVTFIQLGPGDIKAFKLTQLYRQGLTVVNGGFFGGNKHALGEYYHLHNRIFQNLLNQGYVDDDQTLTVLCYHDNPNLFNMVVGDWYDVFRLFHLIRDNRG